MKIQKVSFLLIGFAILLTLLLIFLQNEQPSFAKQGILDLNETPFSKDKLITLNGDWEFYGGKLYNPDDFKIGVTEMTKFIQVPGTWTAEDEKLGIGTYRLVIKNVPIDKALSFKKQNIRSASKIFINGKLVSDEGIVAKEHGNYVEENFPKLIFFQSDSEQIELIIQVSNFSYNSPGITNSIYFGEQEILVNHSIKNVLTELAIITVLMTIGLIYILLYLFVERYRRKEFFILSFALSCIIFAFMNLCLSERTILYFIPSISFEGMFKIKDISIFLATITFIVIVTQIEKRLLAHWLKVILIVAYSLIVLIILFTPLYFYQKIFNYFVLLNCFTYLLIMVRIAYFCIKRKSVNNHFQLKIIMFSIMNINVYNINLLLYTLGLSTNLKLGFLNILIYAITLTIFLTILVNQSYKKNEYLTNELDVTEQAYLVAQIKPHFFFNTLTSVMSLCYTDGKKAAQLLAHFSSFLRQAFEFNSQEIFITVEREMKLLNSYIAIEKERFGEKLRIEYDIDPDALSVSIIPLSIQPIVENAILHGIHPKEEGGVIKVSILKEHSNLVICVSDNGVGIPSEKVQDLKNGTRQSECGVGLSNINKRLAKYYRTQIKIESESGLGTMVKYEIPIQ